jgi:hypothetical protein
MHSHLSTGLSEANPLQAAQTQPSPVSLTIITNMLKSSISRLIGFV